MNMKTPFQSVNRVSQSEWAHAPKALSRAKVGDLLHLGEVSEERGGLLKVRKTGTFVSLTADQAWLGRIIEWPNDHDSVSALIIEQFTDRVMFIPRDRPVNFAS